MSSPSLFPLVTQLYVQSGVSGVQSGVSGAFLFGPALMAYRLWRVYATS